ncbi:MAG: hypothetical protein RQ885_03465 [Desulfurococcales archaeon]|jgi:hypothetical protein|nr:hypothetical protein [Desulfurococcales archaeon]
MSYGILVPRINGVENIFFTSVAINTHRGWVHIDLEPSKEFYKLLARGFKPTSHAKIKLDRKNRRGYSTYPLGRRLRSIGQRILLSL